MIAETGSSKRARPSDALPEDIGQRLRGVREERGIGLRELSRRLGVSPSALSQIETGRTSPSVMTLYSIVTELEMSLDDLFRVPPVRPPGIQNEPQPAADVVPHEGHRPAADVVVHAENRRTIDLGTGVRLERLTPLAEAGGAFLFVTYEGGSSSSWVPLAECHAGREYGLVLSGRIRVGLGREEHELGPGDSIAFDMSLPHRIDNAGDGPATAVWCMVGSPGPQQ